MRSALIFIAFAISTGALAMLVLMGIALYNLYRWRRPSASRYGNCWSFAIPLFLSDLRRYRLVVSASRYVRIVPHVQVTDGDRLWEFVPVAPRRGFRGLLDSFWFHGKVRVTRV
jgi:hypothetical protein